jgi:GTP cyclohydrolase I
MEGIAVPLSIKLEPGTPQSVPAKVDVFVNLVDNHAKGIHMSRLHGAINQLVELECNQPAIDVLVSRIIESQSHISTAAKIRLTFELLLKKPALVSGEFGYQSYPVSIQYESGESGTRCEMEITIPYSSTCPCSASLSRQLLSNEINQVFPEKITDKKALLNWIESEAGSIATPHSQRSYANVHIVLGVPDWPDIPQLIAQMESAIGTPVQTAVKRSDEQEFARLNATNLMFCEDAARKLKRLLQALDCVEGYWLKVEHQESLHAHNAVVIDQQNYHR